MSGGLLGGGGGGGDLPIVHITTSTLLQGRFVLSWFNI